MAGRTIWYCYQLNEKVNKKGNPYIGKTKDLKSRAKRWMKKLELEYIPELIILHTDTSEQRIFDYEQERRVANGWPRERSLRHQRNIRKKGNKKSTELETLNSVKTFESLSKGGKIGGKTTSRIVNARPDNANKIQVTCPHCGKTGQKLGMYVWHFDKCKHRNDL